MGERQIGIYDKDGKLLRQHPLGDDEYLYVYDDQAAPALRILMPGMALVPRADPEGGPTE